MANETQKTETAVVITLEAYNAMTDDEKQAVALKFINDRESVAKNARYAVLNDAEKRQLEIQKRNREAVKALRVMKAAAKPAASRDDSNGAIAIVRDVINAMPRAVKTKLVNAARAKLPSESKMADSTIRSIRSDHLNAARSFARASFFNAAGLKWLESASFNDE